MNSQIVMPNLGAASDEAQLVIWLVKQGDRVTPGQPLYEVETDKSLVTVEAAESGQIGRLLVQAGETVRVGTQIAEFVSETVGESPVDSAGPSVGVSVEPAPLPSQSPPERVARADRQVSVSPRARRVAVRLRIDPATVTGTGPGGTVTEADIIAAAGAPSGAGPESAAATSDDRGEAVPSSGRSSGDVGGVADPLAVLTGSRAVVARRMWASSQETAAVTLMCEAEGQGLMDALSVLRARHADVGKGFTLDLLVARCVARTLQEHPSLNASLTRDGLVVHNRIDVGIALDASIGLIVAVVRDAATQALPELARTWLDLRDRALAGNATPAELTGGTFTVTNLGHLGVGFFTPIINLGETAILGLGRVTERPAVRDGLVVPARVLPLSLTFDHRIVDGAAAALFLRRVSELIAHPLDAE